MTPLVSIVIPTYNRASDLERALRSVLSQTFRNWEAVIVDNHSSDNTDQVVKGFNDPRLKLFKIHNNGVIAASRNLGISNTQGEYVAFLDSDDWWMPEKLEQSLKYLENGADLVYHDLFLVTKSGQKFFLRKDCARDLRAPVFDDLLLNGNALKNSSVVVRKSMLNAIEGLSEDKNLVAMEDFDAWLRAARVTERFARVPHTLGYYWAGGGNTSNPQRTLKCIGVFEERYADDLRRVSSDERFWWLYYSKGRANYLLGDYEMAESSLNRINIRYPPLVVAAKSLWMRLSIKRFLNSRQR